MNMEELLQEAKAGNMVAQYELAEYYGRLLRETDNEDEIYNYSKQAMIWLKKSAKQGYKPAVDAVSELNKSAAASQGSGSLASQAEAEKPAPAGDGAAAKNRPLSSGSAGAIGQASGGSEPARPQGSAEKGERYFASTAHIIVVCMLVISLLINVFLLYFLFRIVKSGDFIEGGASSSPTPSFLLSPSPTPDVSPSPTPSPTPEPTPSPTPEAKKNWLDLTKYSELKVLPDEIYDDYVYYTVTAQDSLNMRSGPGTDYEKLGGIPGGAKVGAVADSGGWYLVYYDNKFGWVKGDYISSSQAARPSASPPAGTESSASPET